MSEKYFGLKITGDKKKLIRILNIVIIGLIALVIILACWFSTHGGFTISFETDGGSEVQSFKYNYGEYIEFPEMPTKPGYNFVCWVTSRDDDLAEEWIFDKNTVEEDMTLYALWEPAEITVKFDLDGGNVDGEEVISDEKVVYGEVYGNLPIPEKEGYTFDGWVYSGEIITEDTTMTMTGEHILTARWI